MHAFMDWNLIYRDEREMRQLTELVPKNHFEELRVWRDELKNIIYLSLRKKTSIQSG